MKKQVFTLSFLFCLTLTAIPFSALKAQIDLDYTLEISDPITNPGTITLSCPSSEVKAPRATIDQEVDVIAPDSITADEKYKNRILAPESGYECSTCPGESTCGIEFVSWNNAPSPTPNASGTGWVYPELPRRSANVKCSSCTLDSQKPDQDIERPKANLTADPSLNQGELKAFPNPANTYLQIEVVAKSQIVNSQIVIHNSMGQRMYTILLDEMSSNELFQYELNINNWPKGMYFLHYTSGKQIIDKQKILVQ